MPPKNMPRPPFMYGFILGCTENISYDSQVIIEDILSIDHEMMGMMGHEMMDMNHKDTMMMHYSDQMHCQNHKIDMEHEVDDIHDDEDEKHEETTRDCNYKMTKNHKFEYFNSHYRRVNIDEILG
ncbi:MAG TPA: hypothetical protein VF839_00425 [Clostridium sp.]